MAEWWSNLTSLNRFFYMAATFFSVFFVWQLIAVFVGLDAGEAEADLDGADGADGVDDGVDVDTTYDDFEEGAAADAAETATAFKLLSVRSALTFLTLFTWGAALYLDRGNSLGTALTYSVLWGLAGMLSVALVFYLLRKLSESGTADLQTCVGRTGTVYVAIPATGEGQVRVTVSGVVSCVKARATGDSDINAGTVVRVARCLDTTTVEVEAVREPE